MSEIRIVTTVSAEEMIGSLRDLEQIVVMMRRDRLLRDIGLMRRRYGRLRYLMPRWWRLNNQLKGMKP